LRLNQRKHRLNRDRGIDRASASVQHVEPRLRREWIGGDDEWLACLDRLRWSRRWSGGAGA